MESDRRAQNQVISEGAEKASIHEPDVQIVNLIVLAIEKVWTPKGCSSSGPRTDCDDSDSIPRACRISHGS